MTGSVKTVFHRIVNGEVQDFMNATKALNSDILDMLGAMVIAAFEAEYVFICEGVACKQPDDAELKRMTEPTYRKLRKIQDFREHYQRKYPDLGNHLATISESVAALSWITYEKSKTIVKIEFVDQIFQSTNFVKPQTPLQFIRDMKEAGDYYGNRVLTANKGKAEHITWINKWHIVLTALEEYVKTYHRTGFTWDILNTPGTVLVPTSFQASAPPPPPPPPSYFDAAVEGGSALEADRQELLRQINQGIEIVNILKPVSTDRTAKLAASPTARPAASPSAQSAGARFAQRGAASSPSHPPVFALDGKKWRVEYQIGGKPQDLIPNDKSESLVMFKCDNYMLETKGKMNAVTIDNCKKTQIMLQHIISSVELIRCEKVEIHCGGTCPNITLDNCDSVSIFLNDNSLNCEIITAKCTSTNVSYVGNNGDWKEHPVPEQIRSVFVNKKLQTSVVEHHM